MQIQVNGEAQEVTEGLSVSALIAELQLRPDQLAIELNKEVLRRAAWESTSLKSGDRIEIVHFVGGGCTQTLVWDLRGPSQTEVCAALRYN